MHCAARARKLCGVTGLTTDLPGGAPQGDALRVLWERRGRHTLVAGGWVWARHRGPVYAPLAPEARLDGPVVALDAMLREARVPAVRVPVADPLADAGAYVLDLRGYALRSLSRSARRNVVRGLEGCVIRRLEPQELGRLGLLANQDTLRRQRRSDPEFGEARGWARFVASLQGVPELRVHAAFVDDVLATWTLSSREGPWLRLLWKFGRSHLRGHHADHALDFRVLSEAAAEPGLVHAVDGHTATLGDVGLDQYKRSHGFRVEPHRKVTRFHPWLAPLTRSRPALAAVRGLRRMLPEETRLALGERLMAEQDPL